LLALAEFRDPALVIRTLEYAVSAKVRNQDAVRLVRIEMSDRRTRDIAWQWVQENWPQVQTQMTTWGGGYLVESTGNFCSAERSSQVTEFFRDHTVLAASHALDRARDNITDCVKLRDAQGTNLKRWLQTEAPDASHASLGKSGP
jgi:aminopeptidase N